MKLLLPVSLIDEILVLLEPLNHLVVDLNKQQKKGDQSYYADCHNRCRNFSFVGNHFW